MAINNSLSLAKSSANHLFRLLIATDLLLILIHIIYLFYNPRGSMESYWSIETDRGLGESFQYVKEIALVFMFVWLARRYSRYAFCSWALFFLYILIDDMLRLHERIGAKLALSFRYESTLGLRPEDMGELTFLAVFGVIFFILISSTYFFNRNDNKLVLINRKLISIALFLILFGVITDVFHVVFNKFTSFIGLPGLVRVIVFFILGIIEDGGEMIVMSFALQYTFYLLIRQNLLNSRSIARS